VVLHFLIDLLDVCGISVYVSQRVRRGCIRQTFDCQSLPPDAFTVLLLVRSYQVRGHYIVFLSLHPLTLKADLDPLGINNANIHVEGSIPKVFMCVSL
jgi:hypothetical protein